MKKEDADVRVGNCRGITLVALIITIIVLLILAGVAVNSLLGSNGIIKNAETVAKMYNNATDDEQKRLDEIKNYLSDYGAEDGFDIDGLVNKPVITDGMIPVYYDGGVWKKADSTNKDESKKWYNYTKKQWANIATVESKNLSKYQNAEPGTEIAQSEITTMFVWIPRYSYQIDSAGKKINVSFLQGTSNREADGKTTTKIVHPVFTNGSKNNYAEGGWDRELPGIWIAKFEASGVENGNYVGNRSETSSSQTTAPTANTIVTVLPSVTSWRDISIGESQYRSRKMSTDTTNYGWTSGAVDTHLIKNDEWGAVAYLCYSPYGNVPMTNNCGIWKDGIGYYNMYTGTGPYSKTNESTVYAYDANNAYNTEIGVKASTTGNVYGIYDMAGGAWERVAGYLDNGNYYLGAYGKSTTDSSIRYFSETASTANTATLLDNQKYWCKYEVGEEEKNNAITVGSTTLTQWALWDNSKNTTEYNAARLRMTAETYNKMASCRGIGVNEVASSFGYYGAYVNSSGKNDWNWFTDAQQPNTKTVTYGRAWDSDLVLIGHSCGPFVKRGGDVVNGADAGVFYSNIAYGHSSDSNGFRPALVVGT